MFRNTKNYLKRAVESNTGVSTLSLIVVVIGIMAVIVLIVICVCMLVEIIATNTISSSLEGYASIIGAVSTLIASVGIPKAINNYGENKYNRRKKEIDEDST